MAYRDDEQFRDPYDEDQQRTPQAGDQGRFNAIQGYYSKYLGRTPDQSDSGFMGWVNGGHDLASTENYIKGSDEAKQWNARQTVQPATQAAPAGPTDGRGTLSGIFSKYGLDPNNPGHGLANVDYFAQGGGGRANPGDIDYWSRRTEQEIRKALFGEVGDLIDTGSGAPAGMPAAAAAGGGGDNSAMFQALMDRINAQDQAAAAERAANKQKADALYGQLEARSKQALAVDRNDPVIRAQSDAFNANQERSRRNYLADLAERSGPLANLRGEQRMASERAGQASGSFEAELMGRELTSRRAEIADALHGMRGMLSADQQNNLQRELSSLDAAIKQTQLGVNKEQFGNDLAYRYANLAQQGDQFTRNLGQQESQFGRDLGYRYENMDNELMRELLARLGS